MLSKSLTFVDSRSRLARALRTVVCLQVGHYPQQRAYIFAENQCDFFKPLYMLVNLNPAFSNFIRLSL